MNKVIFIVGPTASGKTALSVKLAKKIGGEIISADSMQIYKGIHIASAAPDEGERQGIPHHMLEFLEQNEEYSVAEYVKNARRLIKEISEKGKIPVIVGGTGLYISSLLDNTEYTEQATDLSLRKALEEKYESIGGEQMLKELAEFDPDSAKRLHPNNKKRIIRAFEVYKQSGINVTQQNEMSHKSSADFDSLVIGITYQDRELLYERINKRVEQMCENGLLDEARISYDSGNSKGAFQAIGHKELFGYFEGRLTLEQAKENLKQQTRRYAKRQLTWFRKDQRINWIYADKCEDVFSAAQKLINDFLRSEKN